MVLVGFYYGERHADSLTACTSIYTVQFALIADIILEREMRYGVLW